MKLLGCIVLLALVACASKDGGGSNREEPPYPPQTAQHVVDSVAMCHADRVVRLTLHAVPTGGQAMQFVASTVAEKIGLASDPEDLRAFETGEVVVLHEGENYDVTIPLVDRLGRRMAVAGVTLSPDKTGPEGAKATALTVAGEMQLLINSSSKKFW